MLWAPLPTDSLATASLVLLTGTKPILHEEALGPEVAPGSLWIQVQRGLGVAPRSGSTFARVT